MTIVHPPSLDRDTNAIEHLDFAPPCEFSGHVRIGSGPAVWLVWYRSPLICGCRGPICLSFCEQCWAHRSARGGDDWVVCTHCGLIHDDIMANIRRVERI